jgi:hypothetical protein
MRRILRDGWRALEITTLGGLVAPPRGLREESELTAAFRPLLRDPANAWMARTALTEGMPLRSLRDTEDLELADELAQAALRRSITVDAHRLDRLRSTVEAEPEPPPPPPAAEPPPPAEPALTWIEIMLMDEDGQPRPGIEYQVKLPDGQTRSGKLGSGGYVRLSEIPKGDCEISFPELDAKAWKKV